MSGQSVCSGWGSENIKWSIVSLLMKVIWLPAGTVTSLGLTPFGVIVMTTDGAVLVAGLDGWAGALAVPMVPDPPHAGHLHN
jgi:hypothetical protein